MQLKPGENINLSKLDISVIIYSFNAMLSKHSSQHRRGESNC